MQNKIICMASAWQKRTGQRHRSCRGRGSTRGPLAGFPASAEAYMVSGATYDVIGGDSGSYTA
jgi:hypothetical protein